jgi:small subunit ribosomal protein S17
MATKATTVAPLVQQYITSQKVGVVVSAGKMSRAVKVRIAGQEWNKTFRKHFPSHKHYTVSDPNNSLVEGDVVRITSGHRTSSTIRHVVTAIVAPFGEPVENRPRVLNADELDALRTQERLLKDVRAAERGREASVQRLAQAAKQGVRIPTLEEAVEKLRVHEETEKTRAASRSGKEAHRGQGGQTETKRERKKAEKVKSRAERHAAERAESAKKQVA